VRAVPLMAALVGLGAMVIALSKYLLDTYSQATIAVAVPATVLVGATAALPYWIQKRRCARQVSGGVNTASDMIDSPSSDA
jgi:hypothetical protein